MVIRRVCNFIEYIIYLKILKVKWYENILISKYHFKFSCKIINNLKTLLRNNKSKFAHLSSLLQKKLYILITYKKKAYIFHYWKNNFPVFQIRLCLAAEKGILKEGGNTISQAKKISIVKNNSETVILNIGKSTTVAKDLWN